METFDIEQFCVGFMTLVMLVALLYFVFVISFILYLFPVIFWWLCAIILIVPLCSWVGKLMLSLRKSLMGVE